MKWSSASLTLEGKRRTQKLYEKFFVTAIEESKDLDEINVQELIGSLQTYELSLPNQRVEAHNSSDEDVVEKDVAYLAKNFRKFLKFKNSGKLGDKGKFTSSGKFGDKDPKSD